MRFSYKDCLKAGLLREIHSSKEKAKGSITAALKWLEEADNNLKNKSCNSSVLASYLAMFHSARAILFFDGFREKNHYCIARYLEEKYVKTGVLELKWVELLDYYRELRHDDQYSINFFTNQEESENALKTAKLFVKEMEKLLKQLECNNKV